MNFTIQKYLFSLSFFRGPNDDRFGDRFFPVNDLYSKDLRDLGKKVTINPNIYFLGYKTLLAVNLGEGVKQRFGYF